MRAYWEVQDYYFLSRCSAILGTNIDTLHFDLFHFWPIFKLLDFLDQRLHIIEQKFILNFFCFIKKHTKNTIYFRRKLWSPKEERLAETRFDSFENFEPSCC